MTVDPALAALADRIAPPTQRYTTDPVAWVTDRLNGYAWSKQRDILESIRDHKRTAVHSAHDLGKSFIAAQAAAWWIDTHPTGDAFVVSTAPTYKQVHSILWEEIRKAHRNGDLPGRVLQSDIWRIGEIEVGYGRKPADTDEHSFQGLHRRYVLVIIDEACGVPAQLWNAVEAITTNADCRILAIGNPDDQHTEFGKVCAPGSGWNVIHLDGLASPNFTDEPVPDWLRPLLLDPEWVEDKKRRWGEDSPIYRSKVRGLFSESSKDIVIPYSWLAACQVGRDYVNKTWETKGQGVALGVDVGAGGDETVITAKGGPLVWTVLRDRQPDTMRTTGLVVDAIRSNGARRVNVDVIGIGKGVVDRLHELQADGHADLQGVSITGVNVGGRSREPQRFVNLRAEIWWNVGRVLSEEKAWDLSELDEDTIAELSSPSYTFDSAGRIKIQAKDETRELLGRSPDSGDSVLLAAYVPASADVESRSTIPPVGEPVVQRGDLTLRGRQYVDRD